MFQFEGFTLDVARRSLRAEDRAVQLRPKSFEVLRYLVENADRLVTKDELIKAVWPNVIVTDDALMHCVSEARQAIADSRQTLIATVPRRGYRFTAPVLRLGANAAAAAPAPPALLPSPQGGGEQGRGARHSIGPASRCCPSPTSAATRSKTISATASPRTLQPSCRGSPSSWSSRRAGS